MTSRNSVNQHLIAPPPGGKYDPASEAAFRREVQKAFDVIRFTPQTAEARSIDFVFDASDDKLYLKAVAGPRTRSVRFQIADNDAFTSPEVNEVVDMTDGDVATRSTTALVAADRGKVWYARATPYSGPSGGGQAGTALEDTEFVPLTDVFGYVRETFSETASLATLTLIPFSAAIFDQVKMATQVGNAAMGGFAAVVADGSGNYVGTVALVEKHPSKIAYQVLLDSVVVQENIVTFDAGTAANVVGLSASYDGGTATVTANFDSDTEVGASGAEYSIDSGGAWTALTVAANRTASFAVTQSTSASIDVWVRGYNSASVAGEYRVIAIEPYVEVVETAPSVVTARAVDSGAGSCPGTYQTVDIYWSIVNSKSGYSIQIVRVEEDGGEVSVGTFTLAASPEEDEFTGFDGASFGADTYCAWSVRVVRTSDSQVMNSLMTNTLFFTLTAC